MGYKTPDSHTLGFHSSSLAAPADSTTYYIGGILSSWTTTDGAYPLYIPKAGRIVSATILLYSVTPATAEDVAVSIRLNSTTDYPVATIHWDAVRVIIQNLQLNIPVKVGDQIQLKFVTPAWVTNPLTCIIGGWVVIESG